MNVSILFTFFKNDNSSSSEILLFITVFKISLFTIFEIFVFASFWIKVFWIFWFFVKLISIFLLGLYKDFSIVFWTLFLFFNSISFVESSSIAVIDSFLFILLLELILLIEKIDLEGPKLLFISTFDSVFTFITFLPGFPCPSSFILWVSIKELDLLTFLSWDKFFSFLIGCAGLILIDL